MTTVGKILHILNRNLLFIFSVFLLIFIPLFPKIPLFDVLPGYIVRVRPEDLFVLFTGLIWLRDIRAKRIVWNSSYFWFVCIYACVGILSILSGMFLLQTIPLYILHIGKSGLHFFRYLEYFSVFFFLFSSIKTKRHVFIVIIALVFTTLGVVGYGIGQKYLHFPVYSTMNREYSKGGKLYLEEGARPQSTFAGPYDLAAFLVIALPLLFSLSLGINQSKSLLFRISVFLVLQITHLLGLGMLILSGSAISLVGYVLAMAIALVLHLVRLPTIRQRLLWGSVTLLFFILSLIAVWFIAPQRVRDKATVLLSQTRQDRKQPSDLVGDGFETRTIQVVDADGSVTSKTVREKGTWSVNALKYGLSMGIRLDTLWPQALRGFMYNPLTGSGYGTLAMLDVHKFVEADSTDNNFLRTLGETGILGMIAYYGIILFLLRDIFRMVRSRDQFLSAISIGFIGSIFGLFTSALYLDVFAASKVAFTFWAVAGLVIKTLVLEQSPSQQQSMLMKQILTAKSHVLRHWPLYLTLIISFFLLHQNPYMDHTQVKNIDVYTKELEQLTSTRCFLSQGSLSICRNTGLTLASHISLYSILFIPFYTIFQYFGAFYFLNIFIVLIVIFFTYTYIRHRTSQWNVFFALLTSSLISSLFHITQTPLTDIQLLLLIGGLFLSTYFITLLLRHFHTANVSHIRHGLFICVLLVLIYRLFFTDLTVRFRDVIPHFALDAVTIANGFIFPSPGSPAYLITTLNPYFADIYSNNQYTLLPLSQSQPYARFLSRVWGIADSSNLRSTYTSLLSSRAKVFMSDYNVTSSPSYIKDFNSIKQAYDLKYTSLGCDEQCNLYQVYPPDSLISKNPVSPFNGKALALTGFSSSYQFAVLSHRFDSTLSDTEIQTSTPIFTTRISPLKQTPQNFLILTGDANQENQVVDADLFTQGFANQVTYPILYTPGNYDILPKKYFQSGFQTFFMNSEYFMLLDVDAHSQIGPDQRLSLYTAFLQLEKLPQIKNLFIIAHDLNWQDTSDSDNVIHVLKKKLQAFPYLKVFIITANHNPLLKSADTWFEIQNKQSNYTFVSSLTAESSRDTYVQVTIGEDGQVKIDGVKLHQ